MVEKYTKKLESAAIASRLITIDRQHKHMFPPPGQRFTLKVDDAETSAKIDKQSRLYLSKKILETLKIVPKDILIFTKLENGTFSVSKTREIRFFKRRPFVLARTCLLLSLARTNPRKGLSISHSL